MNHFKSNNLFLKVISNANFLYIPPIVGGRRHVTIVLEFTLLCPGQTLICGIKTLDPPFSDVWAPNTSISSFVKTHGIREVEICYSKPGFRKS